MNRKTMGFVLVLALALALAGSAAAAADPAPQPLRDARVGEWALYDLEGQMQVKYTVIEVTDEAVTIRMESTKDGEVVYSNDMPHPRSSRAEETPEGEIPPDMPRPRYSEDTLEVNGKTLECTVVELETEFEKTRSWICDDVPVNGLVRLEEGGVVTQKLLDWGAGRTEPAETPRDAAD